MMFGDLGQGALIIFLGIYLYKKKGMQIGKIISIVGASSMVFGVLYGSVFGFEEILPTIWLKPTENIEQILLTSLVLGVVLIIVAMIFSIINAVKQKDLAKLYFSPNGIAGLVFYSCIVGLVFLMVNGYGGISLILITIFAIISILIITFREPLKFKLEGKKQVIQGSPTIYWLETIIEVFEIILTYFTNTLSFIRVGAFALSHAGIMSVVWLLAHNSDGDHNFAIVLFGNLSVIYIEGFIAGIQALRIQFYEMFSRYYKGVGVEFKPCRSLENIK